LLCDFLMMNKMTSNVGKVTFKTLLGLAISSKVAYILGGPKPSNSPSFISSRLLSVV